MDIFIQINRKDVKTMEKWYSAEDLEIQAMLANRDKNEGLQKSKYVLMPKAEANELETLRKDKMMVNPLAIDIAVGATALVLMLMGFVPKLLGLCIATACIMISLAFEMPSKWV